MCVGDLEKNKQFILVRDTAAACGEEKDSRRRRGEAGDKRTSMGMGLGFRLLEES